ncbi:MAG: BrnT family toxin [Cyanobacteria bacterium J06648_10]
MLYQWDPNKAAVNMRKHDIDFADAVSVFADDFAISFEEKRFDEERYIVIGVDSLGRVLVVVYTWRGDEIRLISARKATHRERQQYMEGS